MKKLILIVIASLFLAGISKAQEFKYNNEGLNPKYLVIKFEDKDSKEIYDKTMNWIKETYKNPDKVLKAEIENEKVRFEGFSKNLICVSALGIPTCYDALYTIEISFKDGKLKFEPTHLEYMTPAATVPVSFETGKWYFNRKGKLKKSFRTVPSAIENLFNSLSENLREYVTTDSSADNDW